MTWSTLMQYNLPFFFAKDKNKNSENENNSHSHYSKPDFLSHVEQKIRHFVFLSIEWKSKVQWGPKELHRAPLTFTVWKKKYNLPTILYCHTRMNSPFNMSLLCVVLIWVYLSFNDDFIIPITSLNECCMSSLLFVSLCLCLSDQFWSGKSKGACKVSKCSGAAHSWELPEEFQSRSVCFVFVIPPASHRGEWRRKWIRPHC